MSMNEPKKCFIIMPISDPDGYTVGHFQRVYGHVIQPACQKAGFVPLRADEANKTNFIVADIVQEIMNSDMVICDLSSRNPNVMYELGIRHAFNKPVTLIRDSNTPRVFDVQGMRDLEYDVNLRVDNIHLAVNTLADRLLNTFHAQTTDLNSPVQFLKLAPATVPPATEVSEETSLILGAISGLGDRISALEQSTPADVATGVVQQASLGVVLPKNHTLVEGNVSAGDLAWHSKFGLGTVATRSGDTLTVHFAGRGLKTMVAPYLTRVVVVPESEEEGPAS